MTTHRLRTWRTISRLILGLLLNALPPRRLPWL
jgi:hypothetical protein